MNAKDSSIILGCILLVAGWIGWVVFQEQPSVIISREEMTALPEAEKKEISSSTTDTTQNFSEKLESSDDFPAPTVATVNGKTERTIHMGVRQYAWDPNVITVKQGELVRLIVHNADVQHGLVIPELGVLNIDIPPDGAVIEFSADKVGTFEFFCSYYCGEGHIEMQGKIVVEETR